VNRVTWENLKILTYHDIETYKVLLTRSQLTSKLAAISIGIYRMPLQLLRNQQTSDSSHLSDKKKILAEFIEENGIDDVIDEMLSVYVLHLILIQRLTLSISILSYIAYILIITLFVRKSKNSKN
jgi:hypothetical protein